MARERDEGAGVTHYTRGGATTQLVASHGVRSLRNRDSKVWIRITVDLEIALRGDRTISVQNFLVDDF